MSCIVIIGIIITNLTIFIVFQKAILALEGELFDSSLCISYMLFMI